MTIVRTGRLRAKIASLAALAMATPCLEIKTIGMMPTTEELQCKTESALTKMDLPVGSSPAAGSSLAADSSPVGGLDHGEEPEPSTPDEEAEEDGAPRRLRQRDGLHAVPARRLARPQLARELRPAPRPGPHLHAKQAARPLLCGHAALVAVSDRGVEQPSFVSSARQLSSAHDSRAH